MVQDKGRWEDIWVLQRIIDALICYHGFILWSFYLYILDFIN